MPPTPSDPVRVRPAEAVNDLIRAVVRGARASGWTQAERALYGELRDEWVAAVQADMAKAA